MESVADRITRIVVAMAMIFKKTANPSTAYVPNSTVRGCQSTIEDVGISASTNPTTAVSPTAALRPAGTTRSRRRVSRPTLSSQSSGAMVQRSACRLARFIGATAP